jgi:hypothetical protein
MLALFPLKTDLKSPPLPLDRILSKNYYLTYSDESRPFVPFGSVGSSSLQMGIINRNKNYMVSKSDSGIGILEDSTCFYMDNSVKSITVGPKSFIGNVLLLPLVDPFEIFEYATNNKMNFQKYIEDGKLTYDFICFKQDAPIIGIVISFYNDQSDSFSIKLIYQQLNIIRQDIIRYKFVAQHSEKAHDKIADFLDFKNESYEPKEAYKNFFFGNAYLLRKKK